MKKQIILVFAILIYGALQAQETGNYLDFNVGGGIHNLSYNLQNGTEKGQFGYTINAGYSYYFTPQWGLHTGLGFQSFQSLSTLNYLSSTPDIDSQGESFTFKANYKNWQERQTALFVEIPLTVQYKLPIAPKFGLLASAGGKIAFPFNTTYKSVGGEIVTTGFYKQYNAELYGMPQHGFSTYTNSFTGNLSLKTSIMAIADLGGLYKLNDKTDLYVGGYINYGLNNILNTENKLIYQYNGLDGVYNGLLTSTQTNKINPISFGLKVGVYWHLGQNKSSLDFKKPTETIESVTPVTPVDSVKPVSSVKPVEPEITLEPVKPTEPVKTVQPTEPVQPVTTTETVQTAKTEQPVTTTDTVQTAKNEQPLTPTEPVQIAKTVQPLTMTEPVQIAKPVETVQRPIEPISSVETAKTVQTTQKAQQDQAIQPTEPVKTEDSVLEVISVDHTQKGIESPKETINGQSVKNSEQTDSVLNDDAYERAKIIAASINIMFGFNSTKVTNAKNDKIKELSDILKANSYIHLRFVGHTDNIGSHKINVIFGMKRADNVKQKFIDQGVSRSQLISESKAYDEPLVPNTSSSNRAKNRRVEIKVFK
jgi:outer membrane protein OmpA-like peptidoglycan-associated protein